MIEYFLVLFFLLLLSFVPAIVMKTPVNPLTVLSGVWFFILALHLVAVQFQLVPVRSLSLLTLVLVAITVASFFSGYCFVGVILSALKFVNQNYNPGRNKHELVFSYRYDWFVVVLVFFVGLLTTMKAKEIVGGNAESIFHFMVLLRGNLNYGDASWGGVQYLGTVVNVGAVVLYTRDLLVGKLHLSTKIVLILVSYCMVMSTARTSLFLLFIPLLFITLIVRGMRFSSVIKVLGVLAVAFVFMGILLGKIDADSDAALDAFIYYLLTPISAVDFLGDRYWCTTGGEYTLRFFYVLLSKMNLFDGQIYELVQEYVSVPVPTNVYSAIHAPLTDFGVWYLMLYYFAAGSIYSIFFKIFFYNKSFCAMIIVSFLYYPLVMSFYNDQLMTIISQWMQILILVYLWAKVVKESRIV